MKRADRGRYVFGSDHLSTLGISAWLKKNTLEYQLLWMYVSFEKLHIITDFIIAFRMLLILKWVSKFSHVNEWANNTNNSRFRKTVQRTELVLRTTPSPHLDYISVNANSMDQCVCLPFLHNKYTLINIIYWSRKQRANTHLHSTDRFRFPLSQSTQWCHGVI